MGKQPLITVNPIVSVVLKSIYRIARCVFTIKLFKKYMRAKLICISNTLNHALNTDKRKIK